MKKLLNTLFVTTQNAYLCHEGESVLVRVEQETRLRLPIHNLGSIVCFGVVSCSPPLLGLCAERGVVVTFLTEYGRFLARLQGRMPGNVLLRREQYRRADNPTGAAAIARTILMGKVANSRTVLQRSLRDHPDNPGAAELTFAVKRLSGVLDELQEAKDVDRLRGLEGDAAKVYFSTFDNLIVAQKDAFYFRERSRRPPLDNMNALLSFLYTLVTHDITAALEGVGLDPQVGYLHADRPGRPSLALDLLEEFRPFIADRMALSLVNLKQVQGKGFKCSETGAVMMDDATRKEVLVAYQKRKQEEIEHPFIGEKAPIGILFHLQALLLARHLRGDLDAYPVFVWR